MVTASIRRGVVSTAMLLAFAVAPAAVAGNGTYDLLGVTALIKRLGDDTPTGAGVVAAQIEVMAGNGSYGPNQDSPQYNGKTFFPQSGDPGETNHAHTVGRYQFGRFWSMAPDITEVYLYSATGWVTGDFLRAGAGGSNAPLAMPGGVKVLNNSWVGTFGSPGNDNDVLRRADFVVGRDQAIITSGVNNQGGDSFPLLSHLYNGITVGIRAGVHVADATGSPYDGPGRMKPDMVAFEDYTSFATPQVNAAASLLTETARTWSGLMSNPSAERSDVLKAVLLAGTVHENVATGTWSNEPETAGPERGVTTTPIDAIVGTGTLNIDRSHMILTGEEQDSTDVIPTTPTASWSGWDHTNVGLDESVYWRLRVPRTADAVSIVTTWNRSVRLAQGTWSVADFDLTLWRIAPGGVVTSLVGDDGLAYFSGGNVVSMSSVDNVEHLYLSGLAAGDYILELARVDSLTASPNWDAAVAWLLPEPMLAPEDLDGDGIVGFLDLLAILTDWGDCTGCPEDLDFDGIVGFLDLLAVLSAWG